MKSIFSHVSNRLTAIALGGAIILAGTAVAFTQKPKAEAFKAPSVDETPITREIGGHASFAPVVKKVTPGVVKIFTTTKVRNMSYSGGPGGGPGGDMDELLRRFFGNQMPGRMPRRNMEMPRQEGI